MQRQSEIVEAIHEHWILTGVELDDANDMADELADHLTTASADGKDLEAVVGPDLRAFADSWADPVATKQSTLSKVGTVVGATIAGAICFVGAGGLFEWNSEVVVEPVETGIIALIIGFTATILVGPVTSRLSPSGKLRSGPGVALRSGVLFAPVMGSWLWISTSYEEQWTVTVPNWLVIPAAVFAFVLFLFPLIATIATVEQTNGWTKRILRVLDKFI